MVGGLGQCPLPAYCMVPIRLLSLAGVPSPLGVSRLLLLALRGLVIGCAVGSVASLHDLELSTIAKVGQLRLPV